MSSVVGGVRCTAGARLAAVCIATLALLACGAGGAGAATLFGLVNTGELFASVDQGTTWSVVAALPVRDAVAVVAGSSATQLWLASRSGGIHRSNDGGMNWTGVGAIAAHDLADLVVRANGSLVALTESGVVWRSVDGGSNWTAAATLDADRFTSLARTLPAETLYALTSSGEVYESVSAGNAWSAKGVLPLPDAVELRAAGGSLYVLTGTGDVWRSIDSGANWSAVGTLSQVGMAGLAVDGGTLFAATAAGEVAASASGTSWAWKGAIGQLTLTALAVDTPATTQVDPGNGASWSARLWPNPLVAGSGLRLGVRLSVPTRVRLELHDVAGRRVAVRAEEPLAAGAHVLEWAPAVASAGVYRLGLEADGRRVLSMKVVVVR